MNDIFFRSSDGLKLHATRAGHKSGLIPLVCLPGLTRSTRDFDPVVEKFAHLREVIAFDFRGRGKSDRAANPTSYSPQIECADTMDFLQSLDIQRFAVLGTSRGGIVGMMMAALYPDNVSGLFLNDIGCKIEAAGLKRIIGYVGKPVMFDNWNQAAQALQWSSVGFDNLSIENWISVAKLIFATDGSRVFTDHDPLLSVNLPSAEEIDKNGVPELWNFLPSFEGKPVSLLRGAGSDLLSRETVQRMQQEIQDLKAYEIAGRGHVPFLDEPESVQAITTWLSAVDSNQE